MKKVPLTSPNVPMRGAHHSKFFYGWIIAIAAWLVYFLITTPLGYGIGILSTKLVTDFGWDEGIIAAGTSAQSIAAVIFAVPAGVLLKKFGNRIGIIAASAVGAVCYLCIALLSPSPAFYIILLFGTGISSAFAVLACPNLINSWFDRNRSMPMSLVLTAGAVGGFILPVFTQKLSEKSFTAPWLVYLAMSVITIIVAICIIKENPSETGDVKDGRKWLEKHNFPVREESNTDAPVQNAAKASISGFLKNPSFYFLGGMMFAVRVLFGTVTSYFVLNAIQNGISAETAAVMLSVISVCSLAGRLLAGMSDRIPVSKHNINTVVLSVMAAGGILLAFSHSNMMFYLSAAVLGIGSGFNTILFPLLIPEYFGTESFSVLYGFYNSFSSIGGTVAPIAAFAIGKAAGSYAPAYLITAGVLAVFAVVSVFMKRQASGSAVKL